MPVPIPGPCPGFSSFRLAQDTSPGFFENVDFRFKTQSVALFGNGAWRPTDRLTLELGGRYSSDKLRGSRLEGPLMVALAPRPSVREQSLTFTDFSPRGALIFRPDDHFGLFAVVSCGYRSGRFNLSPGDAPFEKESLWNYEAGIHFASVAGLCAPISAHSG
jgi:outer membrane receptor protein involved in Fe transport